MPLQSDNHVLLAGEPAWPAFLAELRGFLGASAAESLEGTASEASLTPAERDVLRGVAQGLDNAAIARQLGKSEKTVRNQVSSIFDKLGVRTRAEAIVQRPRPGRPRLSRGTRGPARRRAIRGERDNGLMRARGAGWRRCRHLVAREPFHARHASSRLGLTLPPERLAPLALAGAALFWSGAFIAGRALRNDVDPATLTLLRWGLALLAFVPFIGAQGLALPRRRPARMAARGRRSASPAWRRSTPSPTWRCTPRPRSTRS